VSAKVKDNKTVIKVVPVPTAMSKPLKINRIIEEKIDALRNEVADIMASGMSYTSRMKMQDMNSKTGVEDKTVSTDNKIKKNIHF
jgi:aromatic ring-opening dioxygenase catalytic subunit (LigB family)